MLRSVVAFVLIAAVTIVASHAAASQPPAATQPTAASQPPADGMAAIQQASTANRFLLIFFHKGNDANTTVMRKVFDIAAAKTADKANSFAVEVTDPAEKAIVTKFGAAKALMPLALVIAPNGAVTRGLPGKFTEKDLLAGFVGPAWQKAYKGVEDHKLVVVSIQNDKTASNAAANKGIDAFTTAQNSR